MTTALLSALPQEQSSLVHHLTHSRRIVHAGRVFWQGVLWGQPVVLALSGIGKVAAATTATVLIERFGVSRIAFTGVAGGVGEGVSVGDVVIAQDYLQHDLDVSPLFPRWEVPGYAHTRLVCDPQFSALFLEAASAYMVSAERLLGSENAGAVAIQTTDLCGHPSSHPSAAVAAQHPTPRQVHHGLIATGDRFVSTQWESDRLRNDLVAAGHNVLAVEMEGAAVAQVCFDYGVPFAAMRTISDRADDAAHVDFALFVRTVASCYAEHIVQRLLQKL